MYSFLQVQLMHRVRESSAANSAVAHISRSYARESFIESCLGGFSCRREGPRTAAFQYLKEGTGEKGRDFLQGCIGIGQKAVNLKRTSLD